MTANNWKFVTATPDQFKDPAVRKLIDEAMAAPPTGFISDEDVLEHLPRRPVSGKCRLCGKETTLTKEHIPPRSSGNKLNTQGLSFDEWTNGTEFENMRGGRTQQGGIFGYTLCRDCNSFTGVHYGNEYKRWVAEANDFLKNNFNAVALDSQLGPFGYDITFGSKNNPRYPGAFIRQVLSCMCSLSGSWDLAEVQPSLRKIILDQSAEPLPDGIEISVAMYVGPRVRANGPTLAVDPSEGVWRWTLELAYPPFAFYMVIASNLEKPGLGLMMGNFTQLAPASKNIFQGLIEIGFGWSPYPNDFRTRAKIRADRSSRTA